MAGPVVLGELVCRMLTKGHQLLGSSRASLCGLVETVRCLLQTPVSDMCLLTAQQRNCMDSTSEQTKERYDYTKRSACFLTVGQCPVGTSAQRKLDSFSDVINVNGCGTVQVDEPLALARAYPVILCKTSRMWLGGGN